MQLRDFQRPRGEIDAKHFGTAPGHGVRQDAPAASDIHDALAGEAHMPLDPVQTQRIDLMKRAELAFGIPPFVGQITELGKFLRISVDCH